MSPETGTTDSDKASVEVVIDRTTASSHHPSTVVLTTDTLRKIGVQAGEVVQVSTSSDHHAFAVAETAESSEVDVRAGELLTDVPVFSALVCGRGDRVTVSPGSVASADSISIVPVDPTTTDVIEQCSAASGGLIDAVVEEKRIVEFQPDEIDADEPDGPYYARVTTICPDAPARVTENTRVDVRCPTTSEYPRGVLSTAERRQLYTTNLGIQPTDDELRTRLRERLEASLHDLQLLAKRLPDEDIQRVFGDVDDELSRTSSAATDVVALCWLGFDLANDTPNWRVEQAIERALYAHDEDGEVDLRVTRQTPSPAAGSLDQFRHRSSTTPGTYGTLERLWADSNVDPFDLYDATRDRLGEEFALPPAELMIERLAFRGQARRFPMAQVMDVSPEGCEE